MQCEIELAPITYNTVAQEETYIIMCPPPARIKSMIQYDLLLPYK